MSEYAQIIVDVSRLVLDHPFIYRIPEQLQQEVRLGSRVRIPFGRGKGGERDGYIIGFCDSTSLPPERIKEIISVSSQGSDETGYQLIQLAAWMKRHYGSTMITALKTVLPGKTEAVPRESRMVRLALEPDEARKRLLFYEQKHQVARYRLLSALMEEPALPYRLVVEKLHVGTAAIRAMKEAGVIDVETTRSLRNPVSLGNVGHSDIVLSKEQLAVVNGIVNSFDQIQKAQAQPPGGERQGTEGRNRTDDSFPHSTVPAVSLIHGITGSGKTEVYIRIIEEIVQRGRQAIMLIPEISLTYQTLIRFYRHFGNRVSVMNSTLSQAEKSDQQERARRGEIDVIIGPRSALFTPFPRLGVIVIDEEHENSYKNESMPRYHARDIAIKLAGMHHGIVVLGSATPSMESYYHAKRGDYQLYELTSRLTGGSLPSVEIVDMRSELRGGNKAILSDRLRQLLQDNLDRGEQSMLFLNRRGFSGFVSCRSCGHVIRCPHCDVSLSLHNNNRLICHYCGYEEPFRHICPECGSKYISGFHAGTEQVEAYIQKCFPRARILRMDADTTARKGSYERILSAFANEEADILIGTQMIVKGHDFPNVTLVGVLLADLSLYSNDYRASERTFQLLTQAAGRAGRGKRSGNVVIQTYEPQNYAIQYASHQDYKGFYQEEMRYRLCLMYPPAYHMLAILVQSGSENDAVLMAGRIRELLDRITAGINAHAAQFSQTESSGVVKQSSCMMETSHNLTEKSSGPALDFSGAADHGFLETGAREGGNMPKNLPAVLNIGPAPACVSRIRDIYRYVVYIKCAKYDTLVDCKDRVEAYAAVVNDYLQTQGRQVQVQFDFDPMNAY